MGPTHPWTETPSENGSGMVIVPENFCHLACLSINLICPAVLFGSKSDGETTRKEISENGSSFFAVMVCSSIRGDIALSNAKFFAFNCSVSFASFAARNAHPVVPGSSTYSGDERNLKRAVRFQ